MTQNTASVKYWIAQTSFLLLVFFSLLLSVVHCNNGKITVHEILIKFFLLVNTDMFSASRDFSLLLSIVQCNNSKITVHEILITKYSDNTDMFSAAWYLFLLLSIVLCNNSKITVHKLLITQILLITQTGFLPFLTAFIPTLYWWTVQ